tara:strand:- start:66 stop:575 length:510 start_codon:yes stop_codon:yes gene_type:complete
MVIEYIMEFYEYIAGIVCPFMLKYLQDVDDTDNSVGPKSVRFQVPGLDSDHSDGNIENTNNYTEQHVENRDHFDEYTKLMTITDRQVYKHDYNCHDSNDQTDNVNINRYPFKRIHSYSINHYYCGYCSQLINSPEFMYQDEPYCNIRCRNNRITSDRKNKVREHHSFSA